MSTDKWYANGTEFKTWPTLVSFHPDECIVTREGQCVRIDHPTGASRCGDRQPE